MITNGMAGVVISACIMAYDDDRGHKYTLVTGPLMSTTCPKPSCSTRACRITYIKVCDVCDQRHPGSIGPEHK